MKVDSALTPVITDAIGFATTAYIYGALAIVVIWFMALGCHENPQAMEQPKPHLFRTILDIASNPKFWIYGITNAAYFGGLALVQSGVAFYTKYHLQVGGLGTTILLGVVILSAIVSIPVWVMIVKKLTLMKSWRLALACCGLGVLPLYFVKSLPLAAVCVVLFGFAMGGVSTTMDIVAARILDEDRIKTGIPREGTYSSLIGVLNKASGLVSSLAFLLVFRVYGFESGENPGASPDAAARFLTVLFPLAVFALCVVVSRFLRFPQDSGKTEG